MILPSKLFWIHGIDPGWVHGFLGGPPCATWSRARSVQSVHETSSRLPRPVRSALQHIVAWRVTPDLPKGANIGKRQNGEFATAHLKEYPPALCAALASGVFRAIEQIPTCEEAFVNEQFLHRCKSMVSHTFWHSHRAGSCQVMHCVPFGFLVLVVLVLVCWLVSFVFFRCFLFLRRWVHVSSLTFLIVHYFISNSRIYC